MRIDKILVDKGFIGTRRRAQALVMAGKVFVNGIRVEKAGQQVGEEARIEVKGRDHPYVSRGGIKLQSAIKRFCIDCHDKVALDVGASTGGFTDCLLQHGTKRVYAVDVGFGQLDWQLRNDERVINLEKRNIRYLEPSLISEPVDIVTIDCSFISIKLVLIKIVSLVSDGTKIIGLIKPQFEVGKGEVEKGGVVKDPKKHIRVLHDICNYALSLDLKTEGIICSPLKGPKGNREFLIYLIKGNGEKIIGSDCEKMIQDVAFTE